MMRSLDLFGQISPIHVIPDSTKYILIDGYIRVRALAKLGRDTVLAAIFDLQEQAALLELLAREERRASTSIEQACLISELHTRFELSLERIAKGLGKDKSWVKRRLDLLQSLPDDILDLVRAGHISTWSASRILAPLARANREHAHTLSHYLTDNSLSTRELQQFFAAYKKGTRRVRENMIKDPGLYLKVKRHQEDKSLLQVPEEKWIKEMKLICAVLRRLEPGTEAIFASLGGKKQPRFQEVLNNAEQLMANVTTKALKGMDHALTRNARDDTADAREGNRHQGDMQAPFSEQKHCARDA
jgi:ParB/RepB/Spo0J family partition protein